MKLEKGKTKISIEDKLATDLLELIKNKHKSLIRLGNSELIMLFWHIGNKLNKYFESIEGIELEKSVIKSISTRLAAKYGSFFFERDLKKMKLFVDLFPELSEIKQFVYFVSWRHILLLLQISDWNERRFFLSYKIKHGLSVKDLRRKISIGIYEKSNLGKAWKKKGKPPIGEIPKKTINCLKIPPISFELIIRNDKALDNVFKKPILFPFCKLTKPSNGFSKKSKKSIKTQDQLFEEIVEEIEKYVI